MMKLNSFVKRILTCALAAATIATAMPAYTYAEEAEDEVIVVEEDNDATEQDIEKPGDEGEDLLGENDCTFWIAWDQGASVTIIEPAGIAGEVEAGAAQTVEKGTTVKFKVEPHHKKEGKYKVLSVTAGDAVLTAGSDGIYSVKVEEDTSILIDIEKRLKITFEQPDNVGKIGCTPIKEKDNDVFDEIADWPGYIYLKPNADIRWLYTPDKGYSITKVVKVEGDREIELKPVAKPKNEGEVGIYELKNVTEEVTIRRYSKKDEEKTEEPEEETFDHTLTLNNASDYNSIVINKKNVYKGESFGFNDGDTLYNTGLGKGDNIDSKNWTNYFVKWTIKREGYPAEIEYRDGYYNKGSFYLTLHEDTDVTVEGRRVPVDAVSVKGNIDGDYKVVATIASKKGNYINLPSHRANTKVTFAVKKTGSVNYEIASTDAKIRYGSGEPENITLTKSGNSYSYEIPFLRLAELAYSENPTIEFTTSVAAKLPAPTVKVTGASDIDATLRLTKPSAAASLEKLWYRIEATANIAKGKTLPDGMAGSVGPLYVPATVTSQDVYLMTEEGKKRGDGAIQKYDFKVTLLQLETEPEYSGTPLTDKTAVEGEGDKNIVGASPEKKVSGSTTKPGYEEKLGLKKVENTFILGETDITLATPTFGKKTYPEFQKLELAEITVTGSDEAIKTSATEDDNKKITIDENNNIILEDSEGLNVGTRYTLKVWPVSKAGGKNGKPATLALTVKQGIDELSLSMSKTSYVKKPNKPLTIKAPTVTYNGGDKKKAPFKKIVKWELLDENGDPFEASPLYGKVTINNKGAVTVDKDLTIPEGSSYGFKIMATPNDYKENDSDAAKTDVITLTAEEMKPNTKDAELILNTSASAANGIAVDKSDIEIEGVKTSGGKWYVTGEEIRIRIKKEGIRDDWKAGITAKPGDIHVNSVRDGEYVVVSSNEIREKLKKASYFILVFY